MSQTDIATQTQINRRIVLASRPIGAPTAENFRVEQAEPPNAGAGQLLLRNLYLSLDPYMRGRMSDAPSYAPPLGLDEVMVGATVSRVAVSRHPDFSEGDLVLGRGDWQDYYLSNGSGVTKLPGDLAHPSHALSVLGMPGFTAWHGLLEIGEPTAGETVVVAAASGAVGSVVGQIAKIKGCRVVGIAGGPDKCRYVTDELGFDACIDRRDSAFASRLAEATPNGVDIYFENVGGPVFDAVLPLLNLHARVPICGFIAHYNDRGLPAGPDRLSLLTRAILTRRLKLQGFIILDHYGPGFATFQRQMSAWVRDGKVKIREDIVDGLENAPRALIGLLEGENFGKLLVRIAAR